MAKGTSRVPGLSRLAPVAFAFGLGACAAAAASCAGTAPSQTASSYSIAPGPSGSGLFGLPARIGGWRLVAAVKPIGPETAAIVAAAGGDPAAAVNVDVQVYGSAHLNFDVLRMPGVDFDAFMRAAEPYLAAAGLTQRSVLDIGGRTVMRYATPADASGRSQAVFYTQRNDLIYATGYMTEEQFAALLAGLP